jgi:hypothetical protein
MWPSLHRTPARKLNIQSIDQANKDFRTCGQLAAEGGEHRAERSQNSSDTVQEGRRSIERHSRVSIPFREFGMTVPAHWLCELAIVGAPHDVMRFEQASLYERQAVDIGESTHHANGILAEQLFALGASRLIGERIDCWKVVLLRRHLVSPVVIA